MIHITDSQTDKILSVINLKMFWGDKHKKSLKDNMETFDFDTFADKPFSEHLAKRNRIIIPDEDGKYIEFIIQNTHKRTERNITVYTAASYLELAKTKVIYPQSLSGQTSVTATEFALLGTKWQPGIIEYKGIRTFNIEEHTNPFSFLKRIASEFGLELRFRIEIDGNKVIGRFVDLVERVGAWQGREVEFGKDLVGIERKEDTSNVVTALVGLGPTKDDGTRLDVLVEDLDALKRWGSGGAHLIEVYEPESSDQDMTIERLTTLTQNELEKRVNAVVEYTGEIADLEHVPGLKNKKIRFGDTIKIKDAYFNPPLYLEARVHTQERSISDKSQKKVTLGDYIEYTEDQVKAIWKSLQAEIAKKISMADVLEVTYTKPIIDGKDESVFQDGTIYADGVSETAKQAAISTAAADATNKANAAEGNAKSYAETQANLAKQAAIQAAIADAETKINTAKTDLETSIATKADATWVNGQLQLKVNQSDYNTKIDELTDDIAEKAGLTYVNGQLAIKADSDSVYTKVETDGKLGSKADKSTTYTKTEVDNALNSKVSTTTYTADQDGIISSLTNHESRIEQTEQGLTSKVSTTQYNAKVAEIETSIGQKADSTYVTTELGKKADTTRVNTLETRIEDAETEITQTNEEILLKANKTDVYTKTEANSQISSAVSTAKAEIKVTTDAITQSVSNLSSTVTSHGTRLSSAESSISTQAGQIALKANSTDVYTKAQTNTELGKKADNTTVNALTTRVTNAESALTVQANEISQRVTKTEFDGLQIGGRNLIIRSTEERGKWVAVDGQVVNASNHSTSDYISIEPNTDYMFTKSNSNLASDAGFFRWAWYDENKNYIGRSSNSNNEFLWASPYNAHFVRISYPDDSFPKFEKGNKSTDWTPAPEDVDSAINGLDGRISTAESTITTMAGQISSKAESSTVTALGTRVTTAEQNINGLTGEISQKVSTTDYTGNTIASKINQTATTIQLSAAKINLDGYVEAKHIKSTGIIGATIKTASSGSRVELNSNGLKQYDSFGNVIVDMTGGNATFKGSILTGVDITSTETSSDYITLKSGKIETFENNKKTFEINRKGFSIYSNTAQNEVATIRSSIAGDGTIIGADIRGYADYLYFGRANPNDVNNTLPQLGFSWGGTVETAFLFGGSGVSDSGRLSLRANNEMETAGAKGPEIKVDNYTSGANTYSKITTYIGKDNKSPIDMTNSSFQIWQYRGVGGGVADCLVEIDTDASRGKYASFYVDDFYVSGSFRAQNQPHVVSYRSSTQSIQANVATKIAFNALSTRSRGDTSGFNTTAYEFTAPRSGLYFINAYVTFGAVTKEVYLSLYLNGSPYIRLASGAGVTNVSGSTSIKLQQGDTISVYIWSSEAATIQSGVINSSLIVDFLS